jgi:hypothetical protein
MIFIFLDLSHVIKLLFCLVPTSTNTPERLNADSVDPTQPSRRATPGQQLATTTNAGQQEATQANSGAGYGRGLQVGPKQRDTSFGPRYVLFFLSIRFTNNLLDFYLP